MHPVRRRRLVSDFYAAQTLCLAMGRRIVLENVTGDPPEGYIFAFQCRSLSTLGREGATYTQQQRVRLYLPAAYPAQAPLATILTPVLHPHIYPDRTFCLGSWRPQEKLDSLLLRIGSTLCFDPAAINPRSVADDDAAAWVRRNKELLPLDPDFLSLLTATGTHAGI